MNSRPYPDFAIAVVDDEVSILDGMRAVLRSVGITNVVCIRESPELTDVLEARDVGLVLLDLSMPGLRGEELIPIIRHDSPELPIVVVTGNNEVEKAVECMKAGVADYLTKPVEPQRLIATIRRIIEIQELRREKAALQRSYFARDLERPEAFAAIVTVDPGMRRLLGYAETVARTRHPVLILGETGSGKELVAMGIHNASGRTGEFVAVNSAGLDETMFSDALFGHRKGAFTGAAGPLAGLLERAANGTLFLDEIGDLAHGSQVKLLRLLESGEYYPLGSDVPRKAEARILVATNTDPAEAVRSGRLRKDLYFRLKTHQVSLPPLRERREDIPALLHHFLQQAAVELGMAPPELPAALFPLLQSYPFPGNVRELKSMVVDAVSTARSGSLSLKPFQKAIGSSDLSLSSDVPGRTQGLVTIKQAVEDLVENALKETSGNRRLAAKILGITPQALGQRLKKGKAK